MSNLRKYRESLNISQTTLAKAVGCTQGAMARLARQVASILTNKKRPAATERSEQIQMEF